MNHLSAHKNDSFFFKPKVQAKFSVNQPNDICEQEADAVADKVIRMTDNENKKQPFFNPKISSVQRKCAACGIEEKLQTKTKDDTGANMEEPSIVQDVINSEGQQLDNDTMSFMESRFGQDFSGVRVHADAKAKESARAMNALAYTVGYDIVFGAGQYVPETTEGRRLVSHELTHVMQQTTSSKQKRSSDFALSSIGNNVLQRKPDKATQAEARQEKKLEELAQDPGKAHQAWKKLSQMEQIALTVRMRQRYGGQFEQRFLEQVKKGKPKIEYHYYKPGTGPKTDDLIASGYRFAGMLQTGNAGFEVEVWVHPSGMRIHRDVSTYKFGADETEKKKDEAPITQEPVDELTKLRKKFEDLKRRIWRAMAVFEANVERLESNPNHPDRVQIEADIRTSGNAVRNMITELSDLATAADSVDESIADKISSEWGDAMEQYSDISTRYHAIQ